MNKKEYYKLVRDYFPELMREKGKDAEFEILDNITSITKKLKDVNLTDIKRKKIQ